MNMASTVDGEQIPVPSSNPEMQMWGKMMFRELERVTDKVETLEKKIDSIQVSISKGEMNVAVLNVKAGIAGVVAGTIGSAVIGLAFKFIFK